MLGEISGYLTSMQYFTHGHNKHWWTDPKTGKWMHLNDGERFMLMVSEIAEAMEGVRKDKVDDHLPQFKSVEVELADCIIRILDYCGAHDLRLGEAFEAKMLYNASRADHKAKARLAEGGKKW